MSSGMRITCWRSAIFKIDLLRYTTNLVTARKQAVDSATMQNEKTTFKTHINQAEETFDTQTKQRPNLYC